MEKIFTTVGKHWGAEMIPADSAFQVDWAKKELFGTHAKVYGSRLRRSSDVRTSVCVRLCDFANFIVEN